MKVHFPFLKERIGKDTSGYLTIPSLNLHFLLKEETILPKSVFQKLFFLKEKDILFLTYNRITYPYEVKRKTKSDIYLNAL